MARNNFPRGSTEPTQSPAAESAAKATGWRIGAGEEFIGHESTNNKPTVRGLEANTGDGRASRQATFEHQDTHSNPQGETGDTDWYTTGDTAPYGDTGKGTHSQGGVGGVRDGGMSGPAGENFDS